MNKPLCISLILGVSTFSYTTLAANQLSTNIGLTSNYIWRGVTQSDDRLSLSGGADYSHNSGLYTGVWAATVDFNDDTNFEYDFYTGYQKEINDINFDFGYLYYGYQSEDNLNFSEIYLKTSYEALSFGISTLADSDAGGSFADSTYFETSYSFSLPHKISMDIHAGYYKFDGSDNYQDYNVTFSKGNFSLMISTLEGNDALEDTLVALSYGRTFDL